MQRKHFFQKLCISMYPSSSDKFSGVTDVSQIFYTRRTSTLLRGSGDNLSKTISTSINCWFLSTSKNKAKTKASVPNSFNQDCSLLGPCVLENNDVAFYAKTELAKTFGTLHIFSKTVYFNVSPPDNVGSQESRMCHKHSTVKGLQH